MLWVVVLCFDIMNIGFDRLLFSAVIWLPVARGSFLGSACSEDDRESGIN